MTAISMARVPARSANPKPGLRRVVVAVAATLLTATGALTVPLASVAQAADASAPTSASHHGKHAGKHGERNKDHKKGHGKNRGKKKPKQHPGTPTTGPSVVFGAGSEWKRNVSSAPVASDSSQIVKSLVSQVTDNWGGVADFHYNQFDISFATASAQTPRTTLTWDNCFGYSWIPAQLFDPTQGAVFVNVPIPADAVPAPGTDGELSVWNPDSNQLWEFWQAHHEADGWHACWGGRIDNVSTSSGVFPNGTGVSASGLASAGGAIAVNEAQAGQISHAMSLNVIDPANWSEFSYPAVRSDGSLPVGTPGAVREGQRLRLDPSVRLRKLHLSPVGLMIAKAAKQYGFIVVDRGGAVALNAEDGTMTQNATGTNPWSKLLGGANPLQNFPWDKLQALPVDYGKPTQ